MPPELSSRRTSSSTTSDASDTTPLRLIDPSPIDYHDTFAAHPAAAASNSSRESSSRIPSIALWRIHFTTTAIIPNIYSIDVAENSLILARVFYQSALIEPCLVMGSLAVHVLSGVALRAHRMRQQSRKYGRVSIRDMGAVSYTGYILLPFACVHVLLMRALPLTVLGGSEETGLRFAAHGLSRFKLPSAILYSSLIGLGLFHVGQGWCKWIQPVRKWRRRIARCSLAAAAVWCSSVYFIARAGASTGYTGRQFDKVYNAFFNLCTFESAPLMHVLHNS